MHNTACNSALLAFLFSSNQLCFHKIYIRDNFLLSIPSACHRARPFEVVSSAFFITQLLFQTLTFLADRKERGTESEVAYHGRIIK